MVKYNLYIVLLILFCSCSTKTEEKAESFLACDLCLAYEGVSVYARKVKDSAVIKEYEIVESQIDSLKNLFGGDIDSARKECKKILKVKELYSLEANKESFVNLFYLCGGGLAEGFSDFNEYKKIEEYLEGTKKLGNYFETKFRGMRFYLTKFEYLYLMQYVQKQYILQKRVDLEAKKKVISKIKNIDKGRVTDLDVMIFSDFVYSAAVIHELDDLLQRQREKVLKFSVKIEEHVSIDDIITEEENEKRKLEVEKIKALQEN